VRKGVDWEQMGLENPLHIAVLVVILLLVFGAKRLPEIGR
jgi:Sec-independent protein translocase protein TatA